MSQLAQQLGRTTPELYRMVMVLCDRGYIQFDNWGIVATSKAFHLALDRPEMQNVLAVAEPEMERLSAITGHACYLAVADDAYVVAIAAQPSAGAFALDVRAGMRQPIIETAAGQVHYGLWSDARKQMWRSSLQDAGSEDGLAAFVADAEHAAVSGQAEREHRHMRSVTEISSPVLDPVNRMFALSLLYLHHEGGADLTACRSELLGTAGRITQVLCAQRTVPGRDGRQHYLEPAGSL